MYNSLDTDKNGKIFYTEFLAALVGEREILTEEKLYRAFVDLDKNGSGKIDRADIKDVILHLKNVCGKISFEPYNGFYSGLDIEDLIDNGYEKTKRFHFYSYEMDNDTNVYCEKIIADLV